VYPTWFTLNLSCPNTEDDPGSRQTESRARDLCAAVVRQLQLHQIPLWVKISPDLADEQYRALLRAFAETGVKAIVATNTLGAPAPDGTIAGIGGGKLRQHTLDVLTLLSEEKANQCYEIDLIACGGVQDGRLFNDYAKLGVRAAQYWSALVYRGPLAAAVIEGESRR
jgi:dihydroorotate dehydrogenase